MRFRSPVSRTVLLTIGGLVPVLLLGAASLTHVRAQPPANDDNVPAVKKYKNVKVLKTLTAKQLITAMHAYNDSLGVKCDFCHVIKPDHSGFDLDQKPTKNIARQMIMLTDDLNKHQKVIHEQATCFMCHHGKPEPETHPSAVLPGPGAPK